MYRKEQFYYNKNRFFLKPERAFNLCLKQKEVHGISIGHSLIDTHTWVGNSSVHSRASRFEREPGPYSWFQRDVCGSPRTVEDGEVRKGSVYKKILPMWKEELLCWNPPPDCLSPKHGIKLCVCRKPFQYSTTCTLCLHRTEQQSCKTERPSYLCAFNDQVS